MTRDQIITLVLSRLGNKEKDPRLQQICVLELQNVQRDRLEGADFRPWFLLSDLEYTDTTVGDQRVQLPQYFLEEYEEGSLLYRPDESQPWAPLAKGELDVTQAWRRLTGIPAGVSRAYSLVGLYFMLETPPLTPYQLAMRYYKQEPTIPEAFGLPGVIVTNKWMTFAQEWCICELGALVSAYHLRDMDAAKTFRADADIAKQRLYVQHVARAEANMERIMGYTDT